MSAGTLSTTGCSSATTRGPRWTSHGGDGCGCGGSCGDGGNSEANCDSGGACGAGETGAPRWSVHGAVDVPSGLLLDMDGGGAGVRERWAEHGAEAPTPRERVWAGPESAEALGILLPGDWKLGFGGEAHAGGRTPPPAGAEGVNCLEFFGTNEEVAASGITCDCPGMYESAMAHVADYCMPKCVPRILYYFQAHNGACKFCFVCDPPAHDPDTPVCDRDDGGHVGDVPKKCPRLGDGPDGPTPPGSDGGPGPDVPMTRDCRLEIRGAEMFAGAGGHLYLYHWGTTGIETIFRGQSSNPCGPPTLLRGGDCGTVEVDVSPARTSRDYSGTQGDARMEIGRGAGYCDVTSCLRTEAERINALGVGYRPFGPNSNSAAHSLLRACDLPELRPAGIYPGWGTPL